MITTLQRQKFTPTTYDNQNDPTPPLKTLTQQWQPLVLCSADFPLDLFEVAISQLIHHPEYNSTLILRSDMISESNTEFPEDTPVLEGYTKTKYIQRKLLPRRPGRDPSLEQHCTLYNSNSEDHASVLVLTPITSLESPLPYYHPSVSHLAFRFISTTTPPTIRIEVIPLPNTPTDPNSRLYRTSLALLETLQRYGWGALTNYKKRVAHDCLVPREEYQDLYLVMRERHKHLVDTWQEVTDPLKHVYEDIGIATFLMLFWNQTYTGTGEQTTTQPRDGDRPWDTWPRPPGGFLDFGCGNGLLTHILTSEGYLGSGIDVRARASWKEYPESTQNHLHVYAFDPTSSQPSFLKTGIFIIGNHADELTPWVPVLATIYNASGYLSIPCCAWTFDTKFERSSTPMFPLPTSTPTSSNMETEMGVGNKSKKKIHRETGVDFDFIESLNLGGDGSHTSSYSIYRIWLATLSLYCGWEVECETLRIPSTRNWAIAGRKRSKVDRDQALENAQNIIDDVVNRGVFKTRKPEGKAGDH